MKLCPRENQSQLPSFEAAVDHIDHLDPDSRAPIRMPRVEVRASMIILIVIPKKRLIVGTSSMLT
jgi:hypothetical protein